MHCSVLSDRPIFYHYIVRRLRDPEYLRIVIEQFAVLATRAWNPRIVFKMMMRLVCLNLHSAMLPALLSHRDMILDLAREVLMQEILDYDEYDLLVDPCGDKLFDTCAPRKPFRDEMRQGTYCACLEMIRR